MTTTSKESTSDLQDQARRILEDILDGDQEQHRLAAVDDAVVVGEREVVHRPHHHLAVLDHVTLFRRVHAEDRRLRRVYCMLREPRVLKSPPLECESIAS